MRLAEPVPRFVAPMLVTAAVAPPAEIGWALEVKWDGIRVQASIDGRTVTLRSRRGRDCTEEFPELVDPLPAGVSRRTLLLDGELVCLSEAGRPDFARLRARLGRSRKSAAAGAPRSPATYIAFDLLHADGYAVRRLPYQRRRELLDELELDTGHWRAPRAFAGHADLVAATRSHGLEGVVAKRLDAAYQEGRRSPAWRKVKHTRVETLVVVGWEPGLRTPDTLLVARGDADTGQLRPAGRVALPVSARDRAAARDALARLERPSRARGRLRRLEAVLEVDVSHHGPEAGLVRDPRALTIRPRETCVTTRRLKRLGATEGD